MKIISLLSLIFIFSQPASGQDWMPTGYLPGVGRYDDVYFIDPLTGWTINTNGEIFKTTDGGANWDTVYTSNHHFRAIEFIDHMTGIAGSLNGVVLRTDDGGASWVHIEDDIAQSIPGICGLFHIGDIIYGVGIWSHPAYFIKSEDRGVTWTYLDLSEHANGLVDCYFIDENTGFVSGIDESDGGVILKTTDGGLSWQPVYNTHDGVEYVWKMFFVTDSIAYGSIESFSSETSIVKTIDGGDTWTEYPVSPEGLDIQGIGFVDELKGWVGPRYSPLYETTDGGLTWERTTLMRNINRIFRVNNELLYASGSSVYKYDEGVTFSDDPIQAYYPHDIVNTFPNPFSDHLTITIRIDNNTYTRIDFIDLAGQHIASIYAGKLNQGIHQFTIDETILKPLVNRAYTLLLRTNEGFLTKKVIRVED